MLTSPLPRRILRYGSERSLEAIEEESGNDLREYLLYTIQHGDSFEPIAGSLGILV